MSGNGGMRGFWRVICTPGRTGQQGTGFEQPLQIPVVAQEVASFLRIGKAGIVRRQTGLDHGPKMMPALMQPVIGEELSDRQHRIPPFLLSQMQDLIEQLFLF